MTFLEALILGLIQGLTEFLPVSSSGHLEIGTYLFGIHSKDNLLFSILVHGATALSTIMVFRKDIWNLIREVLKFEWNEATKFILMIIVSMIPVGIVGVLFEKNIEAFFGGRMILVGSMLIVTAFILSLTQLIKSKEGVLNNQNALIIGIAQAVAIMPGISRSGATISTALLLGINRETAARFSFLMVLPPIIGAMLMKTKDILQVPAVATAIPPLVLFVGFAAAFVAGLVACQWMIAIVKKGKLIYFAIYCAIVGGIAIIATL